MCGSRSDAAPTEPPIVSIDNSCVVSIFPDTYAVFVMNRSMMNSSVMNWLGLVATDTTIPSQTAFLPCLSHMRRRAGVHSSWLFFDM